jgi:hypothetical protein
MGGLRSATPVTAATVLRPTSERRLEQRMLDWLGGGAAAMGLGHVALWQLIGQEASGELVGRSAEEALGRLPRDGFVLEPREIWQWVREAANPGELLSRLAPPRLVGLLGGIFRVRSPSPRARCGLVSRVPVSAAR